MCASGGNVFGFEEEKSLTTGTKGVYRYHPTSLKAGNPRQSQQLKDPGSFHLFALPSLAHRSSTSCLSPLGHRMAAIHPTSHPHSRQEEREWVKGQKAARGVS